MLNDAISYLDRRITNTSPGVSVALSGGVTTWTLPYSVAADGSEGTLAVYRTDTNVQIVATRPSATTIAATGDFTAVPVFIGIIYPFTIALSHLFPMDAKGNPDVTARFVVGDVTFRATETTELTVQVSSVGRTGSTRSKTQPNAGPMILQVPVRLPNDLASIAVRLTTPGACALAGLTWRGGYYPQSARRV